MPHTEGSPHERRQSSEQVEDGAIEPGSIDPEEDLARAGLGAGHLFDADDVPYVVKDSRKVIEIAEAYAANIVVGRVSG